MPLFSVIIPTYNRALLLERALKSVWRQSFGDFEVIVVDDGSTDATREVLARHASQAVCLRQDNRGPSTARNLGLQYATGEYIAFLDSDDIWFPWTLQTYAHAIMQFDRPAVVLGQCARFRDEEEVCVVESLERAHWFRNFIKAAEEPIFWGTNYAVTQRSALIGVRGFAEHICAFEDQDMGLRIGTLPGLVKLEQPVTTA